MNKRNLFFKVAVILAAMVAYSLSSTATDWVYDLSKGDATWSGSLGSSGVDGNWYYETTEGESTVRHYMQGSYLATDNFSIGSTDAAVFTKSVILTVDQDVSLNNLSIAATGADYMGAGVKFNGSSNAINFTINGNLYNDNGGHMISSNVSNVNLLIKGNANIAAGYFQLDKSYTVKIEGDIIGSNGHNVFGANGLAAARVKAGTDSLAAGMANPDFVVSGIIKGTNNFQLEARSNAYYSVGGLSNCGSIKIGNPQGRSEKVYIILNNAAGTNYSSSQWGGGIQENTDIWWVPENRARLAIVMNGAANSVQTIYSGTNATVGYSYFTGGVYMKSGTLKISFNQDIVNGDLSQGYAFKSSFGTSDKSAQAQIYYTLGKDGVDDTKTTASHGDLLMEGGTFASSYSNEVNTYGAFRFTNIVYSGGTIQLRCTDGEHIDSIDLTTVYEHGVAREDGRSLYYLAVGGGTVKFADGVATGTKVTFDFAGTENFLIDCDLNGGLGAKIIAWDAANRTLLSEDDFYAAPISSIDDYNAKFTITDDGLYVKYIMAVPEASTFALIFGALALCFVQYRRKK